MKEMEEEEMNENEEEEGKEEEMELGRNQEVPEKQQYLRIPLANKSPLNKKNNRKLKALPPPHGQWTKWPHSGIWKGVPSPPMIHNTYIHRYVYSNNYSQQ
jgi:hypothetical protein